MIVKDHLQEDDERKREERRNEDTIDTNISMTEEN